MSSRSPSASESSSDLEQEPPVVLVLGHSYISRLNDFIAHDPSRQNLALEKNAVLAFLHDVGYDQPGTVFTAASQLDLVWELSPDSVVIDLGSNDLCASNSANAEATVLSIVDLGLRIARIPGVRHVLVCSVIPRLFVPKWKPDYNAQVHETNRLLAKLLEGLPNVHFWRHRSFALNHSKLFSHDGFHFNEAGMLRYYRSIRGVVMKAYKME